MAAGEKDRIATKHEMKIVMAGKQGRLYAAWCTCGWNSRLSDKHRVTKMMAEHHKETRG